MILIANLIGTFVFAISGAELGVQRKLDLFGVLVLATVTALFGGITRDVLIGALPPEALRTWPGLAVALGAGALTFFARPILDRVQKPVLVFDALGLGLFAVTGTHKAIDYGINPLMAALLGMTTGVAGGMLRDLLVARSPIVLHTDIYAVAALSAGVVVGAGAMLHLPVVPVMIAGAALCVALRFLAIFRHWVLPGATEYAE